MVMFRVIGATIKLFASLVIAALLALLAVLIYFAVAVAGWIALGFVMVVFIYMFLGELCASIKEKMTIS